MIFKESLGLSVIPTDWRRANVTLIFKKGSRQTAITHRPVSLTSVFCKLLEGIIRGGFTEHPNKYSLLNKCLNGFISKRSCLTNLLESCDDVTGILDGGDPVDIMNEGQGETHASARTKFTSIFFLHGVL